MPSRSAWLQGVASIIEHGAHCIEYRLFMKLSWLAYYRVLNQCWHLFRMAHCYILYMLWDMYVCVFCMCTCVCYIWNILITIRGCFSVAILSVSLQKVEIYFSVSLNVLTRVNSLRPNDTCVSKLTIIGSDNGFSPGRYQAIVWTSAGILLTGSLEPNFSEILIEIYTLLFNKMHLKMLSGKWQPFCVGLNKVKQVICNLGL